MSMKQAYEKKIEARIDEWDAEISKLKAKADGQQADAQVQYYKEIEELHERQEDLRKKLKELRESGEGAWEDLKAGVQKSYDDMTHAINSAADRF